jgi:hypothetical protein
LEGRWKAVGRFGGGLRHANSTKTRPPDATGSRRCSSSPKDKKKERPLTQALRRRGRAGLPGGFVGTFTPEFLEAIEIANLVATLWKPKSDREKMSARDTLMTMASSPSSWEHLVKARVIKHLIGLLESQSLKSHAASVLTRLLCACGHCRGGSEEYIWRRGLQNEGGAPN